MADNVTLDAGAGGDTIAADDVAGVKYQVVKLAVGADGAASLVANANPIPVSDAGGSVTVDNGGTFAVQVDGSALTSLQLIDDPVATLGTTTYTEATTKGMIVGAVRRDADTTLVDTTNEVGPLQMDANGRLKVEAFSGETLPVSLASVPSHAVTNAGTFAVQVDGSALTSLQLIDDTVFAEDVAAQAADKGIAVLAVRRDADTSLVGTDNDYANLQVNASGSLKVAITSGAGSGGTSIADGASFTRDTTSVTLAAAAVESSAPTLTNGDAAALSMTTGGALRVAIASGGVAGVVEDAVSAGGEEGIMVLAVRRDAASSGVGADGDFAALSVTSDGSLRVSGSSGTTQYAEDLAAVSGDSLCVVGAVRRDSVVVGSGTDGDYSTINVNSAGRLYTTATVDAALPAGTNAIGKLAANTGVDIGDVDVTSIVPGTAATNLGKAEDAAHSSGDVGVMALSVRQDTAAALGGTDADYQPLITDASGRLHVNVGNTVTVGSHAVTNAGTFAVQAAIAVSTSGPAKAEDVASADGDVGIAAMAIRKATPANTSGTDGDWEALQMSAGRLWVDPSGVTLTVASHAVTNAGTFAVQSAAAGVAADDVGTSGNPVLVGGVAVETDGTDPTTVSAEGDVAYLRTDRARRLLVSEHHPRGFFVSADYGSAQTNASVKAAPGASLSLYITDIVISNGATAGNVTLLDGSGGTVVFEIYPAINGGCTISLKNPIRLTANTALCITSTTVTTHSVNIGGYIAP